MRTRPKTTSGSRARGGSVPRALSRRLHALEARGEEGLLLLEVLISAFLIVVIAVGTFTGIDSANKVQQNLRARSQATTLAQQDEERLRSLTTAQLSNLNESKTVTFQKTEYTIVSKSEFVSDTTGESSCNASGNS